MVFSSYAFGDLKKHECKEHTNFLTIESGGVGHVIHKPRLNGSVLIKELEEAMWFIEEVSCTKDGFKVLASHVQYNDPTKKQFRIVVKSVDTYEII